MRNMFLLASITLATNISAEIEPIEEIKSVFDVIPTVPKISILEVEKPTEEVEIVVEQEKLPPVQVQKTPSSDVIFVSVRSVRKEPMVEEEEFESEESNFVSIAEVGPFSPFTIIRKTVKKPIEEELMEVTRSEPEMIHFAQNEDLLTAFYISPKHVSNSDYEIFVRATHHRPPPHWVEGKIPAGQEDEPVINVTYKDAFLYAIWSGKRLPNEAELAYAFKNCELLCDAPVKLNEWTSTPSVGATRHSNNKATINSELSRITYHKVFTGDFDGQPMVCESNHYTNHLSFRVAKNSY